MINKLTIVLTLKDRPEFTRRWMRFMNDVRCPYKILIADGGADKEIEGELNQPVNYPNLDYEYIRYPFDRDWEDFYKKQIDVCKRVKSEYLIFADNDDFFDISYFDDFIEFLDGNPEYAGIRGRTTVFSLSDKSGIPLNSVCAKFYSAFVLKGSSIDNEHHVERIESALSEIEYLDHFQNWYCIHRTKNICQTLVSIGAHTPIDPFVFELMFFVLLLKCGKFRLSDNNSYFKQHGSSQALASLANMRMTAFRRIFINNGFSKIHDVGVSCELFGDNEDRVRIMQAFSQMFEKHILISSESVNFLKIFKEFLSRHPFIYRVAYIIHGKVLGVLGKKKFVKTSLIEPYILEGNGR